jgi:hypothetical protein
LPLLAAGAQAQVADMFPPVQDRQKPLLTLDLQDATTREAVALLFTFIGKNNSVDKDAYGFVSGLVQNATFETEFRMRLDYASPRLTYSGGSVIEFSLHHEPDRPDPDAPLTAPTPSLVQPSDLLPIPLHPTLETIPLRVSGVLLWAGRPWGAILEIGGPVTGEKHMIRENQLVPRGVPEEPKLWVRKIERESVILHRHNGKSLVVPLTDLTPFRITTPPAH